MSAKKELSSLRQSICQLRTYLLQGMSEGFRVVLAEGDFSVSSRTLQASDYIKDEMHTGRVLGPFMFTKQQVEKAAWYVSRFG